MEPVGLMGRPCYHGSMVVTAELVVHADQSKVLAAELQAARPGGCVSVLCAMSIDGGDERLGLGLPQAHRVHVHGGPAVCVAPPPSLSIMLVLLRQCELQQLLGYVQCCQGPCTAYHQPHMHPEILDEG